MKYLKTFEYLIKHNVKEGDYVIIEPYEYYNAHLINYLNNNIGRLEHSYQEEGLSLIEVSFDEKPTEEISNAFSERRNNKWVKSFDENQIVDSDVSKENLELRLAAKKYNIG